MLEGIKIPKPQLIMQGNSLDTDSILEILKELEPLLESRNVDCQKYLPQLRTIPEAVIVAKQIENFDFDYALKSLEALKIILEER